MLKFSVITLFPDIFTPHANHLPLKRALEKGLIKLEIINLRDYAIDKRGTVDSPAYGGGPGMILRPEPIYKAVEQIVGSNTAGGTEIIFLTPRGKTYNQKNALGLSKENNIILVCGRYEGIDQRVVDYYKNPENTANRIIHADEISIGNYVLSGGEVPAMVIMESVTRIIPDAIENREALNEESFNPDSQLVLEHPQYSRPEEWKGIKVPQTLLSGNHKNIKDWKNRNSV